MQTRGSERMNPSGSLSLVRVHNLAGIALIGTASWFLGFPGRHLDLSFAAFVGGCTLLAAAGYAFNDLQDQGLDRIAHPSRPLVIGTVRRSEALFLSCATAVVGIGLLLLVGTVFLFVAPLVAGTLLFYSIGLKNRLGLLGNTVTAILVAAIPILAGLCAANLSVLMPVAVVGFGLTFAREILKDIEDRDADAQFGRRTLATSGHCRLATCLVVTALSMVSIATVAIPNVANTSPAEAVVLGALCVALGATTAVWVARPLRLHRFQQLVKAAMFVYATLFLLIGLRP